MVNDMRKTRRKYFVVHWELYAMLLLPVVYIIIFNYLPMSGLVLAFKDFKLRKGIFNSPWAAQGGMENFIRYFSNYNCAATLRNTLVISIYSLAANMPCSILLALGLNYARNRAFKKTVQMISYFPYLVSAVVIASMINMIFNTRTGALGRLYYAMTQSNLLADAEAFPHLYAWSDVWQKCGFNTIIYLAALSAVDPQLHEAAIIDGANVLHRICHIDLPTIIPMVAIMLVLSMGQVMNFDYQKILAMQNQNNIRTAEVISTYSYKVSLAASIPDFSFGTAIGLFQSAVGLVLVLTTNKITNKMTGNGLW